MGVWGLALLALGLARAWLGSWLELGSARAWLGSSLEAGARKAYKPALATREAWRNEGWIGTLVHVGAYLFLCFCWVGDLETADEGRLRDIERL